MEGNKRRMPISRLGNLRNSLNVSHCPIVNNQQLQKYEKSGNESNAGTDYYQTSGGAKNSNLLRCEPFRQA